MADDKKIRQGSDVSQAGADDYQARRMAGGELASDGVFTKVLRDGEVKIIPTSEVYAKDPDEQEGMTVEDPTVTRPLGINSNVHQRAEREFNTQERGDAVSKRHAQGAAGTIRREEVEPLKLDEGAHEKDEEKRAAKREQSREKAQSEADEATTTPDDNVEEGGFDVKNPSATTLADLPDALDELSDEDVKKAQKADKRAGAVRIYEDRLAVEETEEE